MSLDSSTSAAALVGVQHAQYNMQLGMALLKQQATMNQTVATSIISSAESSIYTSSGGRAVTAPGQIINGRG